MGKIIPWYVWASVGLAVVGVFGGFIAARERAAYIRGQDELQQAIVKRDRAAAEKAQEARNALDECYDTGGTWIQSRGLCVDK